MDRACYIPVIVAPLDSEFVAIDSGHVYDQRYACIDGKDGRQVRSTLYRAVKRPADLPKYVG